MIWKISDIFVFIFAISLAVNVMIVLFAICQPFLERRFHMRQLSRLLKFFIFYSYACLYRIYVIYGDPAV